MTAPVLNAGEIEALLFALKTVMGDSDHGQHISWEERCRIGREAIDRHARAALSDQQSDPAPTGGERP